MSDTQNTQPTEEQVAQYGQDTEAIDQLHGSQVQAPVGQEVPTTAPATPIAPIQAAPPDQSQNPAEKQIMAMPRRASQQPNLVPQVTPPPTNPAVKKASTMYDIAQALAGGPRYKYNIDVNTGKMTREAIPVSGKHLGLAIALEALSGGLTGMSQVGAGGAGRGGAIAFQQGENRVEKQDQQARLQANADYARQASIAQTNMNMLRNEQISAQSDEEFQQRDIDRSAQEYQEASNIGAVKQEGLTSDQIKQMVSDGKANVTQDMFIPYKVIPMVGKDGPILTPHGAPKYEKLYAQVDPSASIKVDPQLWAEAQKYKIPGTVNGSGEPIEPPANLEMKIHLLANLREQVRKYAMTDAATSGYSNGYNHVLHSGTTPDQSQNAPKPTIKDPQLANIADQASSKYNLPEGLLQAVALQESSGNPGVKDSSAGAIGPFQVMPATGQTYKASPDDLRDPEKNADVAAHYLGDLLKQNGGDVRKAVSQYYGLGKPKDPNAPTTQQYADQVMARINPILPTDNKANANAPEIMPVMDAVNKGLLTPKDIDTLQQLGGASTLLDGNWSTKDIQNIAEKNKNVTPESVGRVLNWLGQGIDFRYNQKQQALNAQKEQNTLDLAGKKEQQKADTEQAFAEKSRSFLKDVPNFKDVPDIMSMRPNDAKAELEKQGVPVPPEIGALIQVAKYAGSIEKYFPSKTYKGTATISAQDAASYIRNYLNPNYNDNMYAQAKRTAEDFGNQSVGKPGGQLNSIDRASQHLQVLEEAANQLGNGQLQDINAFKQYVAKKLGYSQPVVMDTVGQVLGQEVSKVVGGGAALESELQEFRKNLNVAESPDQIKGAVDAYVNLMKGQLGALNNTYQQTFNQDARKMTPETAKVFGSRGYEVPGWGQPIYDKKSGAIVGLGKKNPQGQTVPTIWFGPENPNQVKAAQ